jgi:hypothetical protein
VAKLPQPAPAMSADKALAEECKSRLEACRAQKTLDGIELDIREAYFFTKPRLSRSILSTTPPSSRTRNEDELATGIGSEANEDFATELITAFFPPHVNWCASQPGETVPDEAWEQVKDAAREIDDSIFKAIRSSNFDAELATALVPDAGIGTMAMWVRDQVAHDPIHCLHIPLRELEINTGPDGTVDDRFVVRWVPGRKVAGVLQGVAIPAKAKEKIAKKPDAPVEVVWGYWRDWSEPEDIVWKSVIRVAGEIARQQEYRGEGSCPLIVWRFAPDSLHAFGNGPTIDAIPMLRVVDAISEATQTQAGRAANPSYAYPDDGVMNFENGLEEGKMYPKRPGSKGEIESLYNEGNPNLGFFTLNDLERAIRRKHFADYPEQPGKTPPTATQWIDEMVKAQRRIGTPGAKFWREGPAEFFLRFRYLLERRGVIQRLQFERRDIAIRPQNPATKAQEQQQVQTAVHLLEIAQNAFPETAKAAIDEFDTIQKIKDKMGDQLVTLRDKQQAGELVQQLLSAGAEMMGGGGQPPGGATV